MRIMNLTDAHSKVYTSNVYLILGDWSGLDDVNTLVDVGNDPHIFERLLQAPTGVGKRAIDQVIFTHSHFDHTALLPQVRERYDPRVYAFSPFAGADNVLRDGDTLKCGDRWFQVIHTPGHSDDSILLYCQAEGVLFAGDTPLVIRSQDSSYDARFIQILEDLAKKDIRTIYFGHGAPLTGGASEAIQDSLKNVRAGQAHSLR